jgi:type VI secretion system protein ImpM
MVPSVDRVGRYFPLTVVWPLVDELNCLQASRRFEPVFERAEQILLETLEAEQLEFAEFDRRIQELAVLVEQPSIERQQVGRNFATGVLKGTEAVQLTLENVASLADAALELCGEWLHAARKLALWWTDGSAAIQPSWLMSGALPTPDQFCAMLDGEWSAAGWQVAPALSGAETAPRPERAVPVQVPDSTRAATIKSAGYSDQGPVRSENQDAFVERPDLRLWAVADGLGGLANGAIASRLVCDALVDTPLAADLDAAIEATRDKLGEVNAYLRHQANRPINPVKSGSTIVAMLIRDASCAFIWAGDSRAYRLRSGELRQLTTDHSWPSPEDGGADGDSAAVARAVGGEDEFSPEHARSDLKPGDRFLLCSDGLYRALDEPQLATLLGTGEPAPCCKELIKAALANGTTDNATALVVDYDIDASTLTDALAIVSV